MKENTIKDYQRRYKGICPICGKENWICMSIAMEMGINIGHGSCLGCGTFMRIQFNAERQEMDLEPFSEYETRVGASMKREEVLSVAKPILFNTDMVRAILDGRKTVTRRLLKPRYRDDEGGFQICRNEVNPDNWYVEKTNEDGGSFDNTRYIYPPYNPGDYLYVRETWCLRYDGEKYFYKADKNTTREENQLIDYDNISWKPSIHMQKEAARIFLRVTNVRVERLQDMPHDGVYKEGIHFYGCPDGFTWKSNTNMQNCYLTPMSAMKALWDSTIKKGENDKYGWDANPWVWVIEFERVNAE